MCTHGYTLIKNYWEQSKDIFAKYVAAAFYIGPCGTSIDGTIENTNTLSASNGTRSSCASAPHDMGRLIPPTWHVELSMGFRFPRGLMRSSNLTGEMPRRKDSVVGKWSPSRTSKRHTHTPPKGICAI